LNYDPPKKKIIPATGSPTATLLRLRTSYHTWCHRWQ